jgi:sec-independent protein translocase protein TatB
MFDVGFWELAVVGVVALLVVGPDKLPGLARTVGRWVGRARAYVHTVQADIDREMRLQELQQMIQDTSRQTHDMIEETQSGLHGAAQQMQAAMNAPAAPEPEESKELPAPPVASEGEEAPAASPAANPPA